MLTVFAQLEALVMRGDSQIGKATSVHIAANSWMLRLLDKQALPIRPIVNALHG